MPARTSKLRPVIVYLRDDDYQELEQRAEQQQMSISQVARTLLHVALAKVPRER